MKPLSQKLRSIKLIILLGAAFTCSHSFSQSGFPYTYGDNIMYYPKLNSTKLQLEIVKEGLNKSLPQAIQIYDVKTKTTYNAKDLKSFIVGDDRIEVILKAKKKDNLIWMYNTIDDSTLIFFGKQNAGTFVYLPGVANFGFSDYNAAQRLANCIYALQYPVITSLRDSILQAFQAKVKAFRLSNRIAQPNRTQQQLFVIADSLCEADNIFDGLRTYLQAVAIDEMSNPTAYANMALLYAHINYFDYAIMYMQQYVMLETDAEKIRGAIDKLYEWETIVFY